MSNDVSKNMLMLIINDLDTKANYQSENDMDASDLLVDVITHPLFDKDTLKLLEEQLMDMRNLGTCPSGRVTRLYQIYKSLYEK
jgi:hypothetical protein